MSVHEEVNILMVDDQPGKLLSYEAILSDLERIWSKHPPPRRLWRSFLKRMSPSC